MRNLQKSKKTALLLLASVMSLFILASVLTYSFVLSIPEYITAIKGMTEKGERAALVSEKLYFPSVPQNSDITVLSDGPYEKSTLCRFDGIELYFVQSTEMENTDYDSPVKVSFCGRNAEIQRLDEGVLLRWREAPYTLVLYGNMGLTKAVSLAESVYS